MMINRHNYEEFFLLYADGELNHQQRAAVELFVQQNPDMAAELEMLQQMKLEPEDNIVFPDKTLLFKTTDVEINTHNYGEFFLLFIDKELDAHTSGKVEKFVLQHPALQEEFTLLKQTVLQPEAITFGDKGSLYRREERKVGYVRYMRMAAAAAVTGLVLLGWWLYPKATHDGVRGGLATQQGGVKSGIVKTVPVRPTVIEPSTKQPDKNTTAAVSVVGKHGGVATTVTAQNGNRPTAQKQQVPVKTGGDNSVAFVAGVKDDNASTTQPVLVTNPDLVLKIDKTAGISMPIDESQLVALTTTPAVVTSPNQGKSAENPFVKPGKEQLVAYKEIDTNTDDRSMYIGSLELNKDKVKGFFKMAGRLFGARPKKDTD
jgi:hypothetical protein